MKTIIALSLLFSSVAFACPDLSGFYLSCQTSGNLYYSDMNIYQEVIDGVTVYTISYIEPRNSEEKTKSLAADGKRYVQNGRTSSGEKSETIKRIACENNSLINHYRVKFGDSTAMGLDERYSKTGQTLTIEMEVISEVFGNTRRTVICE